MKSSINCQSLFSFNSLFFKNIFHGFEYPWEILSYLKDIIERFLKDGIDGYTHLCDGVIVGEDVSIGSGVNIEGPTIIGSGSVLRPGAYIRGSVIIGENCVIGNSGEVKNSILMDRAQVPHFNYVGDSILGEGAHLGAGVICSNLRSDGNNVSIKSTDWCIDTGLRKLGAILADRTEIGCGAVLCPGTVVGKNTVIYPLTLARGVYPKNSVVKNDGSVLKKS